MKRWDSYAPAAADPSPWRSITLLLPPLSPFPTIGGQWRRLPDRSIEASYAPDELAFALETAKAISGERAIRQEEMAL